MPRWEQIRGRVAWVIVIALALILIIILITIGYVHKWTGFGQSSVNQSVEPAKTLWDWLDLLIVPIVLAIGAYLFNRSENSRSQKVADQRAQVDRETADQRAQDDALETYFDDMRELLIDNNQSSQQAQVGDSRLVMARARTLTVLAKLDSGRKGSVVRFLSEANLINRGPVVKPKTDQPRDPIITLGRIRRHMKLKTDQPRDPIIKLGGIRRHISVGGSPVAERRDIAVAVTGANEYALNIGGAKLHGVDLQGTDLRATDLSHVDLNYAKLIAVDLRNADLRYSFLVGADLMASQQVASILACLRVDVTRGR